MNDNGYIKNKAVRAVADQWRESLTNDECHILRIRCLLAAARTQTYYDTTTALWSANNQLAQIFEIDAYKEAKALIHQLQETAQ